MEFLLIAALLACPVGMGAMMWWMGRMNKTQKTEQAGHVAPVARSTTDAGVDDLRDEHARLTAQIDQLERHEQTPTAGGRAARS